MDILLCNKFDDAIVAYIVKKWNALSKVPLGRTVIQKLCYFVKSKGIPLDYDFDMYHYGPYSQNLYYRMDDMTVDGIVSDVNAINSNIKTNKSKYVPGDNIDKLLGMFNSDINNFTSTIDTVIDVFREFDHTDLELLSTIHFFQTTLTNFYNKPAEKEEVIMKVKKAKGDKFKDELISEAYNALKKAGIFDWNGQH